jgi:hypothetical protein
MAYREIVSEAKRLPLGQQLQLVEELLRAMRQAATPPVPPKRKRIIPFRQLRGALKPGGALPTDGELEAAYTEHLMEKYL